MDNEQIQEIGFLPTQAEEGRHFPELKSATTKPCRCAACKSPVDDRGATICTSDQDTLLRTLAVATDHDASSNASTRRRS